MAGDDLSGDPRVKDTLLSIARGYFNDDEERVLAYICDSSDGRAAARSRLFAKWYGDLSDIVDGREIEIMMDGQHGFETVYAGALIPKKPKHGKVIQEYVIDAAGQIIVTKYRIG